MYCSDTGMTQQKILEWHEVPKCVTHVGDLGCPWTLTESSGASFHPLCKSRCTDW